MKHVWLIASHQLRQETSKRTFWLMLFSLPLFLAFTIGFGLLVARLDERQTLIGYVDEAGLVQETLPPVEGVALQPLATAGQARQALEAGEIDAYYLLPGHYDQTGQASLVYLEPPGGRAQRYFADTVRLNLLAAQDPAVTARLLAGPVVTVRAAANGREFPAGAPPVATFLPLLAAIIFVFLIMTTSGYMAQAVVEEKANRTLEIVITSVSSGRMMAGKIVGALAIGGLQLAVWLACLALALWLGQSVFAFGWLQEFRLQWRDVAMIVVVALPTYLLVAAFMTLIGSSLADAQDAQQVSALSLLLMFLPLYVIVPISQNPNGPLAIGLSLFPGTSVMTLALRSLFYEVPAWQIAAAAGLALALALLTIWLAGRAFRLTMLRYGQRVQMRQLLRQAFAGAAGN